MSFVSPSGPSPLFPKDSFKHSDPIAINTSGRKRTVSISSGSPSSESEVQTPSPTSSTTNAFPTSAGNSPILSYFFQSPSKSPSSGATFPFNRKFGQPPCLEEGGEQIPVATHARRASTSVAQRFSHSAVSQNIPEPQLERGAGFLRRLSLSNGSIRKEPTSRLSPPPGPPPNSAVTPNYGSLPFSRQMKPRRSLTVNEGAKPNRAPSPMGERILKGHFDGFN